MLGSSRQPLGIASPRSLVSRSPDSPWVWTCVPFLPLLMPRWILLCNGLIPGEFIWGLHIHSNHFPHTHRGASPHLRLSICFPELSMMQCLP